MASFLQTADGDMAIATGRLQLVKGVTEKAQKIRNRLRLILGEWFLDIRQGTPWFQVVFVKAPDLALTRTMLRDVILSVEGIRDVIEVVTDFDSASRELSYSWVSITDDGVEITGTGDPFIVPVVPEVG